MNARERRGDSWPAAGNCLRHRTRPFYGCSCSIIGITIVDRCSCTCGCSTYRYHRCTDPPLTRTRLRMPNALLSIDDVGPRDEEYDRAERSVGKEDPWRISTRLSTP